MAALRSSGTHQRSLLFPEGNKGYPFVESGNRLCSRAVVLLIFSIAYCCRFLLEQPQGSKAEEHERLVELFRKYWVFKGAVWGGAYSEDRSSATPKRHWLYSNDDKLLEELGLAAGHLTGKELAEMTGAPLVKKQKREDGSSSFTGNKDVLKQSQSCPRHRAS